MHTTLQILAASMVLTAACSRPQEQISHSPYSGQEQRQVATLSAQDIAAYRAGMGMGLAKAAELHHYPGPKHVLDLAAPLALSTAQREATQQVYDRMHASALQWGERIIAQESELDSLFTAQAITGAQLRARIAALAQAQGELRAAHLAAHVEMKEILSAAQVTQYDALRGYGAASASRPQHGSH